MEWILVSIPHFKLVHIVSLIVWCGGLIAMPLMISRHDPSNSHADFLRVHHATHDVYTAVVTPAAVVAVISGSWLMFMRQIFDPWFFAKLAFVAMLVAGHAWIGHMLVEARLSGGKQRATPSFLMLAVLIAPMTAILFLVLGKPDLGAISVPAWLAEPVGRQLPFEIPRR